MQTRDSRPALFRDQPSVRRRRRCIECSWAITTFEVPVVALAQIESRSTRLLRNLHRAHDALGQLLSDDDEAPDAGEDRDDTEPAGTSTEARSHVGE